MFVPDEEAARVIEAWERAVTAVRAPGSWPGWPPAGAVFGLLLPGGAGLCLTASEAGPGRPVAGRAGGEMAGIRHLGWDDAAGLGVVPPVGDLDAASGVALSLGGSPLVAVAPGGDAEMARSLGSLSFARWWSGRRQDPEAEAVAPPVPDIDPERAALATVEGRLLLRALTEDALETLALQIALVRRERRATRDDREVAAEERWETAEGLPAYLGGRAAALMRPGSAASAPAGELEELGGLPPSRRARVTGWALGILLDRLEALRGAAVPGRARPWVTRPAFEEGWKAALDAGRAAGLQVLLESHVRFDGGSRDDAALSQALAAAGHSQALAEERARAEEARRARQALVDEILGGRGTLVVLDVGALGTAKIEAPSPAQSIHAGMAVYPRGAEFRYSGGTRLRFSGLALAEDRRSGLLQARVDARLVLSGDGADLQVDEEAVFESGLSLRLPGLEVRARTGTIRPIDGGMFIRLLR